MRSCSVWCRYSTCWRSNPPNLLTGIWTSDFTFWIPVRLAIEPLTSDFLNSTIWDLNFWPYIFCNCSAWDSNLWYNFFGFSRLGIDPWLHIFDFALAGNQTPVIISGDSLSLSFPFALSEPYGTYIILSTRLIAAGHLTLRFESAVKVSEGSWELSQ